MAPSRADIHDPTMDVLAVVLGIVMFAALYALIFGIERV
jgi:hypothetical protein